MRIPERPVLVLAGALVASACTSMEPTKAVPDEHAVDPQTAFAPPATPPPIAGAAPAPVAMPPAEGVAVKLHPVVRGYMPIAMHDTRDGSTFVVAGPLAMRLPASGPVVRDPHALDGREDPGERYWLTLAFGGRWPDALTMVTETHDERASYGALVLRWSGNAWKPVKNVAGALEWTYGPMQPWIDGSVITQRTYRATNLGDTDFYDLPEDEQAKLTRAIAKVQPDRFEILAGARGVVGPRFGARPIDAYASLASGHLFAVAGREALHWTPGGDEPSVQSLPEEFDANAETRVWAFAPDDVVAVDFGEAAMRFDGKSWAPFESPANLDVGSLSLAPDGTLWLVKGAPSPFSMDDNELWRRAPGKAWELVRVPAVVFPAENEPAFNPWSMEELDAAHATAEPIDTQPMEVFARKDGLWLTVATYPRTEIGAHRWALLHDHTRGAVLELPEPGTLRREILDRAPIRKFDGRKKCRVFVPVSIASDASVEELTKLRDGVAAVVAEAGDAKLVEIVLKGERRIGVWLRDGLEPAVARTLVAAIRKRVGASAGAPICREAELKRVF